MSQHEQNVVGSIDPFAHTSSSKVNAGSDPLRVSSDNLYGSTHHSASPPVGGEVYQQSQAPHDPPSASKIPAIITTTTTTVTTESTTTQDRKPSLTDTLIAGAAAVATTATNAATNAVAAARRLVGNDRSSEIDLNSETPDTVQTEETSSSSKGGILNFMKSSFTNSGLSFSQRKLSSHKHKSHRHHVSSATAAAASVPTVSHTTVHHDAVQHPTKSVMPNNTTTQTTTQDSNTQHTLQNSMQHPMQDSSQDSIEQQHPAKEEQQDSMQQQQNPMQQAMPVYAQTATPAPAPTNISFSEEPPIRRTNNNGPTSTSSTTAAAPTTSFLPRRGSIADQTAVLKEPHNTFYVTHQGGANSQALGVDEPSVSSTSKTIKTKSHSGLGVDKPLYVGVHDDPKTQSRIRGGLHVDKEPVFSQHALNDPNNEGQDSQTGNMVEANSVTDNENPAPLNYSVPLRRRLSNNGLNVDPPSVATSNIAGSGSTDNTNTNRPKGTYNSGYNVDRAGHHDQKTSGFGVDKPAIVTHHLATAPKLQNPTPIVPKTTTTNSRSHSPTINPQNNTIHPHSTTTTTSETVINPAEMGPTVIYQNPASLSTSAPVDPIVIPADYKGPIPQVNPGEKIIWVKKTVVKTEYYDSPHDNTSSTMPPAPTQDSGIQNRRGSSGSFLDRIRGRRSSVVSADKGKQRT